MNDYIRSFNGLADSQCPFFIGNASKAWISINPNADDASEKSLAVANSALKIVSSRPEDNVGKCFGAAMVVSNMLLRERIKHVITIGDVQYDGQRYFKTTREILEREMEDGCDSPTNAKAHAWITLENGTIMDMTIKASIAMRTRRKPMKWNEAIFLSTKNNLNLKHIPIMLGLEYQARAVISQNPMAESLLRRWASSMQDVLAS